MKPIELLDEKLNEMLNSRVAFTKHFQLDDLVSYIDYLIINHRVVVDAYSSITPHYLITLAQKLSDDKKATDLGLGIYVQFKKYLTKDAASAETEKAFSSLLIANDEFISILGEIKENLDKYFSGSKINIFNMRLSHTVLLGLFYQSEQLSQYSKYMHTLLAFAMENDIKNFPKYRESFLEANSEQVVATVNTILNGAGAKDYAGIIKNIKINAADFTLMSEDGVSQVTKAANLKLSTDANRLITSGAYGIFGIRNLVELSHMRQDYIRTKRNAELEWLKAHTAIMSLKLEGMSEDDKEYVKLKKIVDKYEAMISKEHRKLSKDK